MKLNIKDKAVNEIIDYKFVTRMKVKVFAEKLGMMTLILDNEKINVTKGYNEFTINLKNINSGIYLIQAEINGICSKFDKLIIVR